VDTNDLEAGSYTITANVADNAKRKHHQTASCQATFGVKAKSAPVGFAAPSKTEPSGAAPGISAPSNTEPNKAVPSGAEPTKTAPSSSEPSKAEPNKVTEPSNNAPSGTELSVPAPGNAEPLKAEPPNAVPSKAAPTSATPSTPATSNPAADSAGASVAAGTRGATASTPGAGSARASESNAGEDQPPTASVSVAPNALKSGDTVRIAQPPQAERFGSIDFQHDVKRPTRVDNMAKGELDRYADALAASPDSRGVVVGYATARENAIERSKRRPDFAARRAVNTKGYLSRDKGIDPARIQPRAGHGGKNAELWVVPAGATVPEAGTAKVNEAKVKAVPRVARKADTTVHKKQIGK
jgi:hypothetical protein